MAVFLFVNLLSLDHMLLNTYEQVGDILMAMKISVLSSFFNTYSPVGDNLDC